MDRLSLWLAKNTAWLKGQLTRRGRSLADAEDLIHDGIVRVYEYRARGGEVREPESGAGAHGGAALHQWASGLPPQSLYAAGAGRSGAGRTSELRPEEHLDIQQRLEWVMRVLEGLPDRTREVFLLHRLAGAGQDEIARQLGISVSAVEKHVARAVAALVTEKLRE